MKISCAAVLGSACLSLASASLAGVAPVPWPAVDGLGRAVPTAKEAGPLRADRTVALFYFLWLGPHSQQGGPWDVTKILAQDPAAMQKPDSPLWGPLGAAHHWSESIFGYYNADDPYVLRKHAQMLSDAGVDTVVFDVTNQFTYRQQYTALLETWAAVRREGGRTPQVAFLCPFWQPAKVVRELWRDLYEPGLHRELWFQWDGKPFILADPDKISGETAGASYENRADKLPPGGTLGQTFAPERGWTSIAARVPTWSTRNSAATLTLRREGPGGEVIATQRFDAIMDNDWLRLTPESEQAAGVYYLEMSDVTGEAGWWSKQGARNLQGQGWVNGQPVDAARSLRVTFTDPQAAKLKEFFTFRAPQPDYFQGPVKPDMWSWLEVYPQHVFRNSRGEKEQMSVGVAQNAVNGRLGSMSETAGALGRSHHQGARDTRPGAVAQGLNFAEQMGRALQEDPRALFITGWNEWIAGLHHEFAGVREPVMFVDQFDHEHSRDMEPMKGGHGDAYYYQLATAIRRYKGAPPLPLATVSASALPGDAFAAFSEWEKIQPALPDDAGDTAHRDFAGYANHTRYVNATGRNDIVQAKATGDAARLFFHVQTREPLSPATDEGWMWLLLDADGDPRTGWEGCDLIVNRVSPADGLARVERHVEDWKWQPIGHAPIRWEGTQLQIELPRALLATPGSEAAPPKHIDFKWADHMPENGDIVSWLDAGDSAPNGRFNYRLKLE